MVLAAFVVVAGGMRIASEILIPFLAAIFVAVVSLPPTTLLVRVGFPRWMAAITVFIIVFMAAIGTTTAVATAATSFASELPQYENLFRLKLEEFLNEERSMRVTLEEELKALMGPVRKNTTDLEAGLVELAELSTHVQTEMLGQRDTLDGLLAISSAVKGAQVS